MSSERIIIIDDDPQLCEVLCSLLTRAGYTTQTAPTGEKGIEMAKEETYSVAIVDLVMPGINGIDTIRKLKEIQPDVKIILYTAYPSVESSIEAIHEHVFDYLCKPFEFKVLRRTVEHAITQRKLIMENRDLMRQLEVERNSLKKEVSAAKKAIEREIEDSSLFLGRNESVKKIRHLAAQVAPSEMTVLLLGESGTGKDVMSRLIHRWSGRSPKAFVKINCPAIPETLVESELFGHESGSFTGAKSRKIGRFELADGGTIFLDEIGDLPPTIQAKFLQVIENKQFTRIGGHKTINVNARIVAATNAPLEKMVAEGNFRSDLYYRLSQYVVTIPPLRERPDDIPLLVQHFLNSYAEKYNCPLLELTSNTMDTLQSYHWPGNVRELEAVIQRFALHGDESILVSMVAEKMQPSNQFVFPASIHSSPTQAPTPPSQNYHPAVAQGPPAPTQMAPGTPASYPAQPAMPTHPNQPPHPTPYPTFGNSPQQHPHIPVTDTPPPGPEPSPSIGKKFENNEEAQAILAALQEYNWNRRKAAAKLGMNYSALRRRIAKYGLDN